MKKFSRDGSYSDGDVTNQDETDVDSVLETTPSLPLPDSFLIQSRNLAPPSFYFKYPVDLPTFSEPVMRALESNDVNDKWKDLIDELTDWVLSKKRTYIERRETQAIGHSLFNKYPAIGRSGFRPWSHFCRCLSTNVRQKTKRSMLPMP